MGVEATTGGIDNPPFGKTLNSSILVPFPVESCLSNQAPSSAKESREKTKNVVSSKFSN